VLFITIDIYDDKDRDPTVVVSPQNILFASGVPLSTLEKVCRYKDVGVPLSLTIMEIGLEDITVPEVIMVAVKSYMLLGQSKLEELLELVDCIIPGELELELELEEELESIELELLELLEEELESIELDDELELELESIELEELELDELELEEIELEELSIYSLFNLKAPSPENITAISSTETCVPESPIISSIIFSLLESYEMLDKDSILFGDMY